MVTLWGVMFWHSPLLSNQWLIVATLEDPSGVGREGEKKTYTVGAFPPVDEGVPASLSPAAWQSLYCVIKLLVWHVCDGEVKENDKSYCGEYGIYMPHKWHFFYDKLFFQSCPLWLQWMGLREAHNRTERSTLFRDSNTGAWHIPKALIIKLFVPRAPPWTTWFSSISALSIDWRGLKESVNRIFFTNNTSVSRCCCSNQR